MEAPSGKVRQPFYRSLLPWKGDSKRQIVYKVISLAAACIFLACAAYLLNDLVLQPAVSDKKQDDIKSIYYAAEAPSAPAKQANGSQAAAEAPERDAQGRLLRFVSLQKLNPDIVGWIRIPNTIIDLPVLQASSGQPEFYLNHDYNRNYSFYGSIFADWHAPVTDEKSKNMILYGHSLNSGRMFTQLNQYKSLDFFKSSPVFTFDTVNGPSQWKIISVFLTNTLPEQGVPFNYMKTSFKNDSDFLNFAYQMRIRSIYNTGVSLNAEDKILLLSTCSYEFTDFREVVVARRVRPGESDAVDTGRATYNSKVVYPDCWYQKHGGKKPEWPKTYEQAVKNKVVPWGENE